VAAFVSSELQLEQQLSCCFSTIIPSLSKPFASNVTTNRAKLKMGKANTALG
jgi:hypothetical protein